jgi:hypothetical protein
MAKKRKEKIRNNQQKAGSWLGMVAHDGMPAIWEA